LISQGIGLLDDHEQVENAFLFELSRGHIQLREEPYEWTWEKNEYGGLYTTILGYRVLQADAK